ncbi:hypothetical protein FHR83_004035 [Actinoplanes campanulatus]|uniref:AAA domain-containing protein n=1 Tax=Actinoplanes campanulatus TaxID=113559 RepID=A0A7W5AHV0_9ACTN|nr:AAA domain-containing protein [Actinoplanes campanulatus]MBB3096365.1 hypothetical protein [Actinoplanes campanulatus]GGN18760.1 hypothetical protein GCM10010109_32040 [Actinoplanes campanulatus]GID38432.1 hypothetical protein Aca09nite_49380 [Actinoplanes campanulatus]
MLIDAPSLLTLSGPVALVPGLSLPQSYAKARRENPHLADPASLVADLHLLSGQGGFPIAFDDKNRWLRLYARRGSVAVRPTKQGDAYSIEFVEPMTLRNHGRLARSRLRLTGPGWYYVAQLRDVPSGYRAPDAQIRAAWQKAQTPREVPVAPARPARHDAFCDALDLVIEGGRQIEAAKDPAERILPYYEVRSVAQPRQSAAGIYDFLLSRPGPAQSGSMVQIQGQPDLRGRVREVDGERVTVAFDSPVDRRRIPERGELMTTANDVVPRVQSDAVAKLRNGSAPNTSLAAILIDGTFAGYRERPVKPAEPLDDNQAVALRRALAVPDLLCVVGPPGTGKTRTIVEIARAAAARGERVLIASQTNTAVDNVIERLPPELTAVRVGNEDRMSEAARRRTLAQTAGELQRRIADRTGSTAQRLEPWLGDSPLAVRWLDRLSGELASADASMVAHDAALADQRSAEAAVEARHGEPVRASLAGLRAAERAAESASEAVDRLETRLRRAESRTGGILGFWYRSAARRHRGRLAEAAPRAVAADAAGRSARQEYETLRAGLDRTIKDDLSVCAERDRATQAEAAAQRSREAARQAARRLARLVAGLEPAPPPEPDIAAFATWCRAHAPMLRERAQLLADWRARLEQPSEQLHAELIRYADVIGATCIGVGVQRNRLADLDFDLAVVDEAGQIPLPSTLVPLTRARRAVLVGDHHQLPPYVDDDVREWLAQRDETGVDENLVRELLTHSAFERLLLRAPDDNQVLLDRQRRMPAVLADFVSGQFYSGLLKTADGDRPPSPLFRSPLAIVDTSGLPESQRSERRRERTETWQAAGCDNRTEAGLVVRLVQWYTAHGCDWAVIAPYKAQVQLIDIRLRTLLGDEATRERVGTVDTFQGQERDIVIFSFTRSNAGGSVGFLSELRRLNVAITRARDQLVLVGDRGTLTRAKDAGFRHLARELFRYADQHGDVLPAEALRDRLTAAR